MGLYPNEGEMYVILVELIKITKNDVAGTLGWKSITFETKMVWKTKSTSRRILKLPMPSLVNNNNNNNLLSIVNYRTSTLENQQKSGQVRYIQCYT